MKTQLDEPVDEGREPTAWVPVAGGVRLATWDRGAGPPLLLINGLGASARDWGPAAERLEERFRVLSFDNRGAGRSEAPDEPMTLEGLAEDAGAVLDAYGVERAHVVGYSMGGMVAQVLAATRPDRTRRLVLMATHPGARAAEPPREAARAALAPPEDGAREEVVRRQLEAFAAPGFRQRDPEAFERMLRTRLANLAPAFAWQRQLEAILESERVELVRSISAPTLVVHGREDPLIPFENGEMLRDLIPDARLVPVGGCGHMMNWERPGEVVEAIRTFLEG